MHLKFCFKTSILNVLERRENMLGISIYLQDTENISEFVTQAHTNGFSTIFSSLHIPEESKIDYRERLAELGKLARAHQMKLILDISENALHKIGLQFETAEQIRDFGVTGLRIDYGIGAHPVATMSHKIAIYLNASTIDQDLLDKLNAQGANMKQIEAFHNYYPKPETGLSDAFFQEKNTFLKKNGMRISAFVPGDAAKRHPLFEGLPTLEKHRYKPPYAATLELFSLGIDDVYVGDPALDSTHLEFWRELSKHQTVSLLGILADEVPAEIRAHLERGDQNRMDEARDLIRLEESRISLSNLAPAPKNTSPRKRGAITMDNQNYGRYAGEIDIAKFDLPANEKINVIGQIDDHYIDCLPFIQAGRKVKLRFK